MYARIKLCNRYARSELDMYLNCPVENATMSAFFHSLGSMQQILTEFGVEMSIVNVSSEQLPASSIEEGGSMRAKASSFFDDMLKSCVMSSINGGTAHE
jgi:hypothetical protein